jgi:hypothetical protein
MCAPVKTPSPVLTPERLRADLELSAWFRPSYTNGLPFMFGEAWNSICLVGASAHAGVARGVVAGADPTAVESMGNLNVPFCDSKTSRELYDGSAPQTNSVRGTKYSSEVIAPPLQRV